MTLEWVFINVSRSSIHPTRNSYGRAFTQSKAFEFVKKKGIHHRLSNLL